jgi:crossover junction endodeoxyribonuclease RuvC
MGYGVVERRGADVRHVAHGTVRPPRGAALGVRLAAIHEGVREVIETHQPDVVVVEQVFVAANPRSALVLGQARGAAVAVAGLAGLPVDELAAQEVKLAVVGQGSAPKHQVQRMVQRLLALPRAPAQDAADALAAALCRANQGAFAQLAGSRPRRSRGSSRGRGGRFVLRGSR